MSIARNKPRVKARADHLRKLLKLNQVGPLAKKLKKQGKKIVTTNGAFDLLHVGHVRNFAYAKSLGDVLIVGVNSDASVRGYKGPKRPILPEKERAEMIAALEPVDYVFIFNEPHPAGWLKIVEPHFHVKGGDWQRENMPEWDPVEQGGGKMVRFPIVPGHSTTDIIQKVLDAYK